MNTRETKLRIENNKTVDTNIIKEDCYEPIDENTFEERLQILYRQIQECEERKSQIPPQFFSKSTAEVIKVRARLVDWMIAVCNKLKLNDGVFFLTVDIMDRVLAKMNFKFSAEQVFLIGVVSLYIASKYEEREHLPIDLLLNEVAGNAFTKKDVLANELVILHTINFRICKDFQLEYMMLIIHSIFKRHKINVQQSQIIQESIRALAIRLYQLACIDFCLIQQMTSITLMSGILYYSVSALCFHDKINNKALLSSLVKNLKGLNIKEIDIMKGFSAIDQLMQPENLSEIHYASNELSGLISI